MNTRTNRPKDNKKFLSTIVSIRVQPRASKNELVALENKGFKMRLTAPPVGGAANDALVRFLSDSLSIPKSQIEILTGHTSKEKIVRIHGVSEIEVKRVLNKESE